MKKYFFITSALFLIIAGIVFQTQRVLLKKAIEERDVSVRNVETLIGEVEHYVTKDSLSAVKTQVLELKLEDFERFRAADAETIRQLKIEHKKNLDAVITTQMQTIATIRGTFKDSVINDYIANNEGNIVEAKDTIKHLSVRSPWYDFDAELRIDTYELDAVFVSRDSLFITAQTEYRRFKLLGIPLWETNKILSRDVDAVSTNPHTRIVNLEFIEIRKNKKK